MINNDVKKPDFETNPDFKIFHTNWKERSELSNSNIKFENPEFLRWYCGTQYQFRLDYEKFTPLLAQIRHWCLANCQGPVGIEDTYYRHDEPYSIFFLLETDAMSFKLRWLS